VTTASPADVRNADTAQVFGAHAPALPFPDVAFGDLVLAQAVRTPDAEAVRQWDQRLSYRDLLGRAGSLAAALQAHGIGADDRVGVRVARTPAMVVCALGVLLAGGCYVPLDPAGPRQRQRDIAADAGVRVVVGDESGREFARKAGLPFVPTPSTALDLDDVPSGRARPSDLAYVLFTSGSTGRPKGVLTTHRNLVEFVTGCAAITDAGRATRSLGFSSLGFDATAMDLGVPLAAGGAVQLAGDADRADPTRLARFVTEHAVNWAFLTPTVLSLLDPTALPGLRTVLCGGEVVSEQLANRWATTHGRRFFNVYGPTETTSLVLAEEVSGPLTGPPAIGRPLPNHRAYVVDENLRPLPAGVPGELLVGGPGLARGYLDDADATAARFVPDPFSGRPGERLYRTGDLVVGTADGRVAFRGRADGQVKIRGQRIETGEVEAVLCEQPGVREAVVVVAPVSGGDALVAFVTPVDAPDDDTIAAGIADRLTTAMRPARVLRLDTLPRNTSDKVDRAALRRLATAASPTPAGDGTGRLGPAERGVATVWRRVLGGDPAPEEDFFAQGGNSIAAMRLVAALRAELASDVSVEDVFTGRTLGGIAGRVAAARPLPGPQLRVGNPPTLSPPQRRLWFLDQLAPDAAPYNIPVAQRLRGVLDIAALRAALGAVAVRHDVLRWRVPQAAGVPYAVSDPPVDPPVTVVDLAGAPDREADLRARLAADARTPFDLEQGPSWRSTVYRLGPDEHVLAVTLHHSVFDGWSQAALHRDLSAAYALAVSGQPVVLPPAPASYADYAVWRAERDHSREAVDLAWWTEHLRGAPTVLDLPRDHPRPPVQTYRGAQLSAEFPAEAQAAVTRLAAALGTTPASVALAGLGQALHRLTGGTDHVVATVVADRGLTEFDELVGFFVDIVPVRLLVEPGAGFDEHVRRCGAELLAATAHPGAPLERVVEALGVPRDTSRSPLVQVMFNVVDFADDALALPGVDAETVPVDKPGSPFDITVYVTRSRGRLAVQLLYNPDLFDETRMAALLADYVALVGALAARPAAATGSVAQDVPRPEVRTAAPGAAATSVRAQAEPVRAADSVELTATEEMIAAVWREVLGRDSVRVTDNFFDVGGHSLALAAVHAKVTERLGRHIPVVDLFRYPNIRAFASHLGGPVEDPELARAAARAAARRGRVRRTRPHRPGGVAEQEREQ
jgi:mycobactin peptide synthetase MbtE